MNEGGTILFPTNFPSIIQTRARRKEYCTVFQRYGKVQVILQYNIPELIVLVEPASPADLITIIQVVKNFNERVTD